MNKQTRKLLEELNDRIAEITQIAEDVKSEVESIREEEQDKFDNMPEGLQASEQGEKFEEIMGYLDDAINALEESIDTLGGSAESIEEATS